MNNVILIYAVQFTLLLIALLLYFRIAIRFKIIDKPNERSSHTRPVIRGGGIIFVLAVWCWFIVYGMHWPWFVAGITAVAMVSFLDDVFTMRSGVRFLIHLMAVLLIFYQLALFEWPTLLVAAAIIVSIGALNAFNFMDGINGITGVYALITLLTFLYVDTNVHRFTEIQLLILACAAVIIFLFFNFRKKARTFAGDVGSVTIAFLQIFLLLQLMKSTNTFGWALFFLVFGIDAVVTIVYRIRRKENIFKAHRTHLYQYMSNELKTSHLLVSLLYGAVQLIINIFVIEYFQELNLQAMSFACLYLLLYLVVRGAVMKKIAFRQTSPGT